MYAYTYVHPKDKMKISNLQGYVSVSGLTYVEINTNFSSLFFSFSIDTELKAATIAEAALAVMEDVRTEISCPNEILRRLRVFRNELPDRYVHFPL